MVYILSAKCNEVRLYFPLFRQELHYICCTFMCEIDNRLYIER